MDDESRAENRILRQRIDLLEKRLSEVEANAFSVRDFFAGRALGALMSKVREAADAATVPLRGPLAEDAYAIADAMLAERAKSGGGR